MVERVVFAVEVPGEVRETRSLQQAMSWAEDLLIEGGHRDGWSVRLTVEVVGREIDEDTHWLEKRLGRRVHCTMEGLDA